MFVVCCVLSVDSCLRAGCVLFVWRLLVVCSLFAFVCVFVVCVVLACCLVVVCLLLDLVGCCL